MNGAFYIGATGLRADERALGTIANNIANINTTGFKRAQMRFSELVTPIADRLDADDRSRGATEGMQGVLADSSLRVYDQGDIRQTGKAMDIAIEGLGFIEVLGRDGRTELWRGGQLRVNEEGMLASTGGLPLRAMIAVPSGTADLAIGRDGVVQGRVDGEAELRELGRIGLVTVRDGADLTSVGDGLYEAMDPGALIAASPGEDGAGSIMQGSIEGSNVQLSDEMVTLLLLQRAYGANAQVLQAGDQLMSIANNLRR